MKLLLLAFFVINAFASYKITQGEKLFLSWKFDAFMKEYKRNYGDALEQEKRFVIFMENYQRAMILNEHSKNQNHGITQFMDLTPEEFSKYYLGYRPDLAQDGKVKTAALLDVEDVPSSYDWRDHGAVTPVKDQAQCGSCWAFSTTGNIEGVNFLTNNKLVSLSEQELVDCDHNGDQGCNGGLPSNAFTYLSKNNVGLEPEGDYPYKAKNGSCNLKKSEEQVFVTGYKKISEDEGQIAAALVKYGPLSIGINAAHMQTYRGGVDNPFICLKNRLDHGVLIVGYGTDGGKDYWLIKNSWNTSWGEDGYYRIIRGKGKCGLNTDVTTATMSKSKK